MALRKLNVGKAQFGSGKKVKLPEPFKTEKMFKNIEQLEIRKNELEAKKFEVVINRSLLTLQYRKK